MYRVPGHYPHIRHAFLICLFTAVNVASPESWSDLGILWPDIDPDLSFYDQHFKKLQGEHFSSLKRPSRRFQFILFLEFLESDPNPVLQYFILLKYT